MTYPQDQNVPNSGASPLPQGDSRSVPKDPTQASQLSKEPEIPQSPVSAISQDPSFEDLFARTSGSPSVQDRLSPDASVYQTGRDNFYDNVPSIFPEDETEEPKHIEPQGKQQESPLKFSPEIQEGEILSGTQLKPESHQETDPLLQEESPQETFYDRLKDTLDEANINVSKIISYSVGCLVLIAIFGSSIYFGLKWWQNRSIVTEKSKVEEPQEEEPQMVEKPFSRDLALDIGLFIGRELGSFSGFQDKSLSIAFLLGTEMKRFQKRFIQQVDILRSMRNMVKTDLKAYLDQSRDRAKSLDDYANAMNDQKSEAVKVLSELESLIALFETEFHNNESTQAEYEQRFFLALQNYRGRESQELLEKFVMFGRDQVEVRAWFYALRSLRDSYKRVLAFMDKKIQDISLNRKALISGVQVVPVEGSDLNLVITPQSLEGE